nr:probable histone H2A variant 3 [Tanacetum cinerariifolium]
MSGKGAKGLIMGKNTAAASLNNNKDKKKATSRSSRAGLQVRPDVMVGRSTTAPPSYKLLLASPNHH